MKSLRPTYLGGVIGVVAALVVIGGAFPRRSAQSTGPMLVEHGGAIRSLEMQYTSGASFVWPVYRQFLQCQSDAETVYLACPGQTDFAELQQAIGQTKCRIIPVFTGHQMTTWSRDRWVELQPNQANDAITLLAPKGELQQEIWPQRAGDSHVAQDLAKALGPAVAFRRSPLFFDGGDLLCDDRCVFVTPAVLRRNLQQTVTNRQSLIEALQRDLHRPVVLMDDAPDHHAGMYMMAVGNGRMLVADPSLGRPLFDPDSPVADGLEGGPDFSAETQRRFDSVAELARGQGYHVERIPIVPAANGKMYLTYANVIMDVRGGHAIVYMPVFDGQSRLNGAARAVWESLRYEVVPIDCTGVWQRGGTLHCLVNVLERAAL